MEKLRRSLVRGLVAGTAGTTALFATTYLDMAIRGRPASRTPEQTVEQMADLLGVTLPGDAEARQARAEGLGNLLGLAAGVTTGAALGVLRGLGHPRTPLGTVGVGWVLAMVAGNGPMSALKVTDPRRWSTSDWLTDVVPHAAYAVAAAGAFGALERRRR
jgi:hypothetical protein